MTDQRYGPVAMYVSHQHYLGRWPWLSPRAYWLLLRTAMQTDAEAHDALGRREGES